MKLTFKRFLLLAAIVVSAFAQLSNEKEIALGRHFAAELKAREIADGEVIGFTDRVLNTLSRNEPLRLPLQVKVIDNPDTFVASALPGGILLLSSGAILHSENEAEFAALLSHAMAHAQVGQVNRPSLQAGSTVPLIFVGGLWGFCERSTNYAAVPSLPGGKAQADLIESQADMLGLEYLLHGGYDPQALVRVFRNWGTNNRPTGKVIANSEFDKIKTRLAASAATARRPPTLYR